MKRGIDADLAALSSAVAAMQAAAPAPDADGWNATSDAAAVARGALERLGSHPAEAYRGNKRQLREGVLDLDDAELRAFRDELIPRWLSRRDAMAALLPGKRA